MVSPTPNKGYTYPAHGGAVNAWDTPLNTDFDTIDANVGGNYQITVSSTIAGTTFNSTGAAVNNLVATITLPAANAVNMNYTFTGTMGTNVALVFPSAGAFYDINNTASGAFTLTAKTGAGTGVVINQGGSNLVTCDGININYGNSNQGKAQVNTYFGNPNTNVAGVVATVNGGVTDLTWDETNWQLYTATTQGTTATTVWTPQLARLVPEGYLSISADANNPIITSDTTSTVINYVPFVGNWTVLSNGTVLYPYQFSTMSLFFTASQASTLIYDIFMYANPTAGVISPVIGTGPAWSTSTVGSGARGAGAGTTQINRFQGVWTNAVTINLTTNPTNAGNVVISVPANQGIYLGSIFVDSVAGQVTCHRTWGQNRKWGIFNAYNRVPTYLKCGDSTATWIWGTMNTWRASNGTANNTLNVFSGLPEETLDFSFEQSAAGFSIGLGLNIGIGMNATISPTGKTGGLWSSTGSSVLFLNAIAHYLAVPQIGVVSATALEQSVNGGAGQSVLINGTEAYMMLSAKWRA